MRPRARRGSSHYHRHPQNDLTLLRIQRPIGIEPDALVLGESFHLIPDLGNAFPPEAVITECSTWDKTFVELMPEGRAALIKALSLLQPREPEVIEHSVVDEWNGDLQ